MVLAAADAPAALPRCDLVIDGAYGTGFAGSYDAPAVAPDVPVLSIDIPSGVDADTGAAPGAAFRATRTVTFAAYKPGLLQGSGPELSGAVEVADIGIAVPASGAGMVEDADLPAWLAPRRPPVEQVDHRALGIAAGSVGMEGTAVLCSRGAALAGGVGMIRLGTPGDPAAPWPTEAVRRALPARAGPRPSWRPPASATPWPSGPGLGREASTQEEIRTVIARTPLPLVIDADALTALGDLRPPASSSPGEPSPRCSRPMTVSSPAWPAHPPARTA